MVDAGRRGLRRRDPAHGNRERSRRNSPCVASSGTTAYRPEGCWHKGPRMPMFGHDRALRLRQTALPAISMASMPALRRRRSLRHGSSSSTRYWPRSWVSTRPYCRPRSARRSFRAMRRRRAPTLSPWPMPGISSATSFRNWAMAAHPARRGVVGPRRHPPRHPVEGRRSHALLAARATAAPHLAPCCANT